MLVVAGTRPEAIKLAPVVRALASVGGVRPVLVATSQHREMLRQAFEVFGLTPNIDLNVMHAEQTPIGVAHSVLRKLEPVFADQQPLWTVVQGDTTSAFAAAVASFYAGVPVAHVEAGLRTGRMDAPFPEEFNRRAISVATRLHLAATRRGADNLRAEGVADRDIRVVGNPIIDAVLEIRRTSQLTFQDSAERQLVLVTLHRRESLGEPLQRMLQSLRDLAQERTDALKIVFPVHRNPKVDGPVRAILADLPNVELRDPMAYPEFLALFAASRLVISDSGGIQEEAPAIGVPVLIARETTERPEAVESGWARLVGTEPERLLRETRWLLDDDAHWAEMVSGPNPFGDGDAGERIAAALVERM